MTLSPEVAIDSRVEAVKLAIEQKLV